MRGWGSEGGWPNEGWLDEGWPGRTRGPDGRTRIDRRRLAQMREG